MMFGAIFAAGWKVDDILDLTWDQIAFVGESMSVYRAESIRMIAEPVMAAFGDDKAFKRPRKQSTRNKPVSAEEKDAALLHNISALGFNIGE
ncbi:MAG: hypothetical protein VXY65_06860 [Actinomycetota bacterium]|nr:hypothetical protein [Actinomycetota bacterium]